MSAATAFYVFLSSAPLMIQAVAVAGFVFGRGAAQAELRTRLESLVGRDGADLALDWMSSSEVQEGGPWVSFVGLAVTVFAASRLFAAAQKALNQIWGVRLREGRRLRSLMRSFVVKRLMSFAMVFSAGGVLVFILGARALWRAIAGLSDWVPTGGVLFQLIENAVLVTVLALVFAVMFRVLPDARVSWKDALAGATVTAVLFAVGAVIAGSYTQYVAVRSVFGAAGSVAVLLLWVFYCAQVFYLGATFTHVWACDHGSGVEPEPHAIRFVAQSVETDP